MNSPLLGVTARALRNVLPLVLPARCAACDGELPGSGCEGALCPACAGTIRAVEPPFCLRCGEPAAAQVAFDLCSKCRGAEPAFDRLRSAAIFDGAVRAAILAFKFRRQQFAARPFAARILASPEARDLVLAADVVVPVPSHRSRRREHGGNPAEWLAEELGRLARRPVRHLLRKPVRTEPQSRLPLDERRANVRGVFAVALLRRVPRAVVLVDDVATSGSTLHECAKVLKAAGAERVDAVTVARTP